MASKCFISSPIGSGTSPQANSKPYEDLLDGDTEAAAGTTTAMAVAGAEGRGEDEREEEGRAEATNGKERKTSERKTSETFDNPIYVQLGEKGMELFTNSERQGEWGLEQSSSSIISSTWSPLPGTSAQYYSPLALRVPSHPYEEIGQGGSEESLTLTSSLQLSMQQPISQTSIEVDKLTVINEIYSSLPCSGETTPQFLQSVNKLQHPIATTTAANYVTPNGYRLDDRPIVNQVVVSGAFKKKEVGREPNGYHLHMYHADSHANNCDMAERDY